MDATAAHFERNQRHWEPHFIIRPSTNFFEYSRRNNEYEYCQVGISKDGETALHCERKSGLLRAWRTSDGVLLYTSNVPRPSVADLEGASGERECYQLDKDPEGVEVESILLSDDAATLYIGPTTGRIQVFDTRLAKVVGCIHSKNVVRGSVAVQSMAIVECKVFGEEAPPTTHLFSAHW